MQRLFSVLRDIHLESRNGKYSSKKVWGSIILLLVCITYVLDGLAFYTIDHILFNYMLITGAALIGMNTVRQIADSFNSKKQNQDHKEG
jgi:undecaprenyl pyrophosphate phosphatase UppP